MRVLLSLIGCRLGLRLVRITLGLGMRLIVPGSRLVDPRAHGVARRHVPAQARRPVCFWHVLNLHVLQDEFRRAERGICVSRDVKPASPVETMRVTMRITMINNLKRNKNGRTRSNCGMSRSTLMGHLNDRVVCALVDVSLTRRRSMRTRQQVATTAPLPPLR